MFEPELAIKNWKSKLRKNPAFEDGDIAELESHLRDEIERLMAEGLSEKEAFQQASEEIGEPESLGQELYKTRTTKVDATPSWKQASWMPTLLPNYVKVAVRNILKHKTYSLINIFGLSIGVASCLLILLFVWNEWSYDQFHTKSDRIYRAWTEMQINSGPPETNTLMPLVMGPELKANFPEIKSFARMMKYSELVKREQSDLSFSASISLVDSTLFRMFDFELIRGNRTSVFRNPRSLVLSKSAAEQYFGEENPMGKTLLFKMGSEFQEFTITGLIENPPPNSSITYEFLIPFENSKQLYGDLAHQSWYFNATETYLLLQNGHDPDALKAELPEFLSGALGENYEPGSYQIGLQPLTDIHLNTELPKGFAEVSNPVYSHILSMIALLVLLLACINFMTLSIVRSASRAGEVGLRKVIGAGRSSLIWQFWGEALLVTILAVGAGLLMTYSALPFFNSITGKSLAISFTPELAALLAGMAVIISLVAGIYPAFIISGLKPAAILKGKLDLTSDRNFFRKGMIVLQFALSIILIIGAIVINQQLNYVQSKDLGYNKEQVVVIESGIEIDYTKGFTTTLQQASSEAISKKNLLKAEIQNSAAIKGLAVSSFTPVQQAGWFTAEFEDRSGNGRQFHFNIVDHDFLTMMRVDILKGRNFSRDQGTDENRAIIVNQALVDEFGWKKPIGRQLPGSEFGPHEIIGVIENFHFESLHTEVKPLVLTLNPEPISAGINNLIINNTPAPRISVRLGAYNIPAAMDRLKSAWNSISPEIAFNYSFVDESVDSQYRDEARLGTLTNIGSSIAVIIACLGLFGLSSLLIIRRTKEIGVRKVLGASSFSILKLLNKEFTKLVVIAFLLAIPAAWYLLQQWIEQFAYRISIDAGPFFIAGLVVIVVAWMAVSYHTVKAARMNPVESLRSE